jgi:hypothetical protein
LNDSKLAQVGPESQNNECGAHTGKSPGLAGSKNKKPANRKVVDGLMRKG